MSMYEEEVRQSFKDTGMYPLNINEPLNNPLVAKEDQSVSISKKKEEYQFLELY